MILFEEDWEYYPDAIVDYKTKNQSFIDICHVYRSMGIKNYLFPLQLHNPDLQGVDPFDSNLSMEQMAAIVIECKDNFWYFIRECCRIPGSDFDNPIKYNANRANIAMYWLYFNHLTVSDIQPRQTGKSYGVDTLYVYLFDIAYKGTNIELITKDETLRASNLTRIKKIEAELPYYLIQRTKKDVGNTEEISVKSLGNRLRAHLPNKSPKEANKVGRGLTSPTIGIDEFAFISNIGIILPAALPAIIAAKEIAKRKNEPYGVIFTTTAGKKDDKDGAYAYKIINEAAVFTEALYDCKDQEELYIVVRKSSTNDDLTVNCTWNHRQLGYTDQWLKDTIKLVKATPEQARHDFFNMWDSGTNNSILDINTMNRIRDSEVIDYYSEITKYSYIIRWYIPKDEIYQRMNSSQFVAGLDTSDGVGRDDLGFTLRDVRTGEVIATANINETNLISFAEWLVNFLVQFVNVTLIIERRSSGATIIDYLLIMLPSKGVDPFRRLYNKVVQEAEEYKERYQEINKPMNYRSPDIYVKFKQYFGFATSGGGITSRSELYSTTLINAAKFTGHTVRDSKLIKQVLSLEVRNGRIDHPEGEHDDLCIAWLLSFWLMTMGRNLEFYGINNRNILIENKIQQVENDPVTLYNKRYNDSTRLEIEETVESLRNTRDEFVAKRLEHKVQALASRLTEDERIILAVDDLINTIRDQKRNVRRSYF